MDANLIKSTTVYGDHQNPDRASVFYALHPASGRWWKKTRELATYGWRQCVTELSWGQSGSPTSNLVRMHRLRNPNMARAAYLPAYDGRPPLGLKHLPYYGPGRTFLQDSSDQREAGRFRYAPTTRLPDTTYRSLHHNCRCSSVDLHYVPSQPLEYKEEPPMTTSSARVPADASSARATAVASKARVPADAFTVGVRFDGNGTVYHYLTQDRSIALGDRVSVWSPRSDSLVLATVVSVGDTAEGVQHAHEWVVSRVDPAAIAAYRARKDQERALALLDQKIERQARVAQGQLDQRLLAQFDPELQRLIQERDGIVNPTPRSAGLTLEEAARAFAVRPVAFRPRW